MSNVNIVVIDSGVKLDHPLFSKKTINGFTLQNNKVLYDFNDTYGHGTAIYNIIRNQTEFTNIINVKIFNDEININEEDMLFSLEYIYDNMQVDIINLSFGLNICNNYSKLKEIIKKLTDKGIIIVSAFDNAGSISYPAAFDNVIGVTTGQSCNKINDFEYIDDNILNIAAKGKIQRLAWSQPDYIMLGGNSFACAHVTSQIAKFISMGIKSKNEILKEFEKISICSHKSQTYLSTTNKLYDIKSAAIFPFNKEIHSLIRFSDILRFKIKDIYDLKYSGNVGSTVSHLMKDKDIPEDFLIKNINDINWDNIDTLILGHVDELLNLTNIENLKYEIISEAIKHNVNIYAFDNLTNYLTSIEKNKIDRIYYPKIEINNLPPNRFGKLYRISKPVVGVFGTSSRQGKFTLQLILRKKFISQGYKIGQIGTEPTALLYDMDYVFPMGYNSSVFIKEFDIVRYLNNIINELCLNDRDIIFVGSQSGTVTYDTGNLVQFNIPQYCFLMGTQPDIVILCINPFDDFDYIERTIKFIEASVNCKVISLVIFPMDLKNDWSGIYGDKKYISNEKYEILKNNLYNRFKLPILKLCQEDDMSSLVENIINYFSDES